MKEQVDLAIATNHRLRSENNRLIRKLQAYRSAIGRLPVGIQSDILSDIEAMETAAADEAKLRDLGTSR